MRIEISKVHVPKRRRRYGVDDIGDLLQSIEEIGLLHPIVVIRRGANASDFNLVAGQRRLLACKKLGHEKIDAKVVTYDDDDRELAELDENLQRIELTQLERAEHLWQQKQIYERKYPETRVGSAGGRSHGPRKGPAHKPPFTTAAGKASNTSRSHIGDLVRIGRNIPEDLREELRGTKAEDNFKELQLLSKIKDEKEQRAAVKKFKDGKVVSLRAAVAKQTSTSPYHTDEQVEELVGYLRDCGVQWKQLDKLCEPFKRRNPVLVTVVSQLMKTPKAEKMLEVVKTTA